MRANRELDADFLVGRFVHQAHYDAGPGRVEIHLCSLDDCTVHVAGQPVAFAAGERVHVEHSYKYGIEQFQAVARRAGFEPAAVFTDPDALFSVHYLTTPAA